MSTATEMLNLLKTRRSVRAYKPDAVPEALLDQVLEAGTYAPSAMPGKRIIRITDAEGKPLEAQRVYTAAVMDQTFPEDAIQSLTDTGISIQALLTETIQSRKTITPGKDGRFIIR